MTAPAPQPAPVTPGAWTARRILLVAAAVLFTVAALCAGGVITGWSDLAFASGGFAAWALSWAVP